MDIDREIVDRRGEGLSLSNLGSCFFSLGVTSRGFEHGAGGGGVVSWHDAVFAQSRGAQVASHFGAQVGDYVDQSGSEYLAGGEVNDGVGQEVELEYDADGERDPDVDVAAGDEELVVHVHDEGTHAEHEDDADYAESEGHPVRVAGPPRLPVHPRGLASVFAAFLRRVRIGTDLQQVSFVLLRLHSRRQKVVRLVRVIIAAICQPKQDISR